MLNSAAPSSSANRKQHRAATAAKAVLTDLGRGCSFRQAMPDYADTPVNPSSVGRTLEAAYQFGATLHLQQRHRHDTDPRAFAVAASA